MIPRTNFSLPDRPLDRLSPQRLGFFKRRRSSDLEYVPPPALPGKKTLVLDLDETLIHSAPYPPHKNVEFIKPKYDEPSIPIDIDSNDDHTITDSIDELYVYKRPFLDEFLSYATKNFEVFIYTYGERDYAEPILNMILPDVDEDHRLYRDSCILKKKKVIFKDLKMLKRKNEDLIFIDDNDEAFKCHPKNTILIPQWNGFPQDRILKDWLIPILEQCKHASDIRDVIKKVSSRKAK